MKLSEAVYDAGSLGGIIHITRPVPSERREAGTVIVDPWGDLAPAREEPEFAKHVPVITGEAYSHANYGYFRPLMESIGLTPEERLLTIPERYKRLGTELVGETEGVGEMSWPVRWAISTIVQEWLRGRYVVIVAGEEFSLR